MKVWRRVIVTFILAALSWVTTVTVDLPRVALISVFASIILSILCICFFIIAISKQIKPDISGYVIFAWADIILGAGIGIYAVYDILTDVGWFAGLLGWLLLVYVIPIIAVLFIIDIILYIRQKGIELLTSL